MDLIDDLDNDLVFAFLVEGKHRQKIDAQEAVVLLKKVRTVLNIDADRSLKRINALGIEPAVQATSH
jgi:hypothetical protein